MDFSQNENLVMHVVKAKAKVCYSVFVIHNSTNYGDPSSIRSSPSRCWIRNAIRHPIDLIC